MLSMKHAASRPSPPLPSAGSGSRVRRRSRSTPSSASASRIVSVRPALFSEFQQQAAGKEFQRQVVDPLALLGVVVTRARQPTLDDPITQCERRRHEPVAVTGNKWVSPGSVGELLDDQVAQRLDVVFIRRTGDRRGHCLAGRRQSERQACPWEVHQFPLPVASGKQKDGHKRSTALRHHSIRVIKVVSSRSRGNEPRRSHAMVESKDSRWQAHVPGVAVANGREASRLFLVSHA